MPEFEDLYKILGVNREASQQEIAQAYRAKALAYHPDRVPAAATEEVRRLAEEHMSVVNNAHGVLSDLVKRQAYDAERDESNSPPKPMVEPSSILLENLAVGESRRASFVIRNIGGPYEKIWFDEPKNSGLTILNWSSLESDDELPLQVDIEVTGKEWGKRYTEIITVRLDDVETTISIGVSTKLYTAFDSKNSSGSPASAVRANSNFRSKTQQTERNHDLALLHSAFIIAAAGASLHIFWTIRYFVNLDTYGGGEGPVGVVIFGAVIPGVALVIADYIWSIGDNKPNGQAQYLWLWFCLVWPITGFVVLIFALILYIRGLFTIFHD